MEGDHCPYCDYDRKPEEKPVEKPAPENINIQVELNQQPQKVEVYSKEYFQGKPVMSYFGFCFRVIFVILFLILLCLVLFGM